jgi:neutral trehalase
MKVLASFSTLLGKDSKATFYNTLYENTQTVVLEKLYNTNTHQWNDYNYKDKKFNTNFYASNYFPLLLTNKAENQIFTDI